MTNTLSGRGDAAEAVWGREPGWQGVEGRPRPVYDRLGWLRDRRARHRKTQECPLATALDPDLHARLDAAIARLDAYLRRLEAGEALPPEVQDARQLEALARQIESAADNRDGRSR